MLEHFICKIMDINKIDQLMIENKQNIYKIRVPKKVEDL